MRGPLTDARPVGEPEAPAFCLFLRHFEPFPSPEPRHPLVVDAPPFATQQGRHPPVPIPSVVARQRNEPRHQSGFVVSHQRLVALRRPPLPQDPTGPSLRDPQPVLHMLHGFASARRA